MQTALASASQTIADFLQESLEGDAELGAVFNPARGGTMVVSLLDPTEFVSQQLEGLSVWLYRLVPDPAGRNMVGEPRATRVPPLSLRLHFLMTPIVRPLTRNGPRVAHMMLGKVLQVLHEHPRFSRAAGESDHVGAGREFDVMLEPLTLEELARVWSALDQPHRLSASFEAGVIDSAGPPGAS